MSKKMLAALLLLVTVQAEAQSSKPLLNIRFVGDMMIANAPTGEVPNHYFFKNVEPALKGGDILFGNHEGTLCDQNIRGRKCPEKLAPGKLCYAFRSPTHIIQQFQDAGFNVLHLANNHIFDYYESCANETQRTIERAGIQPIGLLPAPRTGQQGNSFENLVQSSRVVNHNGKRIAFLGFHYSTVYNRVISINDIKTAQYLIERLKQNNDLVVVSMHAGAEGFDKSSTPIGTETHMGENRGDSRRFARAAIDAGADLIIGHGPHVLRGMEVYKNKLIAYSLGNFATYTHFSFASPMHLGAIVEASLDEKGNFVQGQIFSTHQYWLKNRNGGRLHVELDFDPKKQGEAEIIKWSQRDFPQSAPQFDGKGRFFTPGKGK